jgi:hypothetical protein
MASGSGQLADDKTGQQQDVLQPTYGVTLHNVHYRHCQLGRMVCRSDAAAGSGGLGPPPVVAGERLHDVQSVGPVIGRAGPPRAAHVFDLDPGRLGEQLAEDVEGVAPGMDMREPRV